MHKCIRVTFAYAPRSSLDSFQFHSRAISSESVWTAEIIDFFQLECRTSYNSHSDGAGSISSSRIPVKTSCCCMQSRSVTSPFLLCCSSSSGADFLDHFGRCCSSSTWYYRLWCSAFTLKSSNSSRLAVAASTYIREMHSMHICSALWNCSSRGGPFGCG